MSPPPHLRRASLFLVVAALAFAAAPCPASGQSVGDLAGWDAMIVSPIGAFTPRARGGLLAEGGTHDEIGLLYGRWRYDQDDAIHNDLGVSLTRSRGRVTTSLTIEYLSLSCDACDSWLGVGAELGGTLAEARLRGDGGRAMIASVGVQASGGFARYRGDGSANGRSAAVRLPIGLALPLPGSRLALSVSPGLGVGRFTSADESAHGVRPMLGSALALTTGPRLILDLGIQRILIDGGPMTLGAGLSWQR